MKLFLTLFRAIAGILFSLMNFHQAKAKSVEPVSGPNMQLWTRCTDDGDCIVIAGICQAPLAINKKYQAVAEKYVYWQNAKRKCAEPDEATEERWNSATAFCENGIARIKYAKKRAVLREET